MSLIGNGMDTLIKLFIILIMLSGCATSDVINTYKNIEDIFTTERVSIDENRKNTDDKLAIFQINSEDEILSTLVSQDNNKEEWMISNNRFLYINDDKIIKTFGFEYDYEIVGYSGKITDLNNKSSLLRFFEPDSGYLEIFYKYRIISKNSNSNYENEETYKLIEESFFVPSISWKGTNLYWVDKNNQINKMELQINPFGDILYFNVQKNSG